MKGIEEKGKDKKIKQQKQKQQQFEAWESPSCQNSQTFQLYPSGFTLGQGLNFVHPLSIGPPNYFSS